MSRNWNFNEKNTPFISKRKGSREKQRSETKYDTGKLSLVDGKTETNKRIGRRFVSNNKTGVCVFFIHFDLVKTILDAVVVASAFASGLFKMLLP